MPKQIVFPRAVILHRKESGCFVIFSMSEMLDHSIDMKRFLLLFYINSELCFSDIKVPSVLSNFLQIEIYLSKV